ncbi:uncharacterized protein LOC106668248 isoform X2 [Cimex lectularius]|uniref:Uncharacterized protein n=1 Tax=Cimex lectularius TaxID=79782 RepID=A0A8I6RVU6_CIMLE|nr:uncharacterized protein LOC106668248 isoform X2 [Cimex lectularius]
MESASVANFDLSNEGPINYFKSSFARSMAFTNTTAQSKSLDYVYSDEGSALREDTGEKPQRSDTLSTSRLPRRSVPSLPSQDPAFPRETSSSVRLKARSNDALKFWKMKQESALKKKSNSCVGGDEMLQEESKDEEILRLRKECQGLMETNRKLKASSASLDASLLQTQIDTLQWQLKQAESNRQMYKAVMEQVSKFLERVQKALESSPTKGHPTRGKSRVPRSRSVHTVVTQSRASSPLPCAASSVHRANSISQIQDSYTTFRDHAWRANRASSEEVSSERLSQEAFRLLRTVQSLLSTREPDLAGVSDCTAQRDNNSMGSCSSLVQSTCSGTVREAEDNKSGGPATPQLSVGSTEDESGFSSMSSFHDVAAELRGGTGSVGAEGSHHELGLPLVTDSHRHRRWSSTPIDSGYRQPIRVLWKGVRIGGAKLCVQKDSAFLSS